MSTQKPWAPKVSISAVSFRNPEEGTLATVDRLVLAAVHHRVTDEALRALVSLTAMACGSRRVVSMSADAFDIDELVHHRLVERTGDRVVLL